MSVTWTLDEQKEHRRLWIEALRSDRFEQHKGSLRDPDNKRCCLGVACDISELDTWHGDNYLYASNFLPEKVQKWLGLSSDEGRCTYNDDIISLAQLNDEGTSFKEIADIIEREPDGLVVKTEPSQNQ